VAMRMRRHSSGAPCARTRCREEHRRPAHRRQPSAFSSLSSRTAGRWHSAAPRGRTSTPWQWGRLSTRSALCERQ
jgi:hypothetical protein